MQNDQADKDQDAEREFLQGFAARIRDLAGAADPPLASHTDLAKFCDVANSTAYGWMNGVALPRSRLFCLIAERLGVPAYALFLFGNAGACPEMVELMDFLARLPEKRRGRMAAALVRIAAVLDTY